MKKMILGFTALAMAGAISVPAARAGDCGWSTAGKVLTGVFAASVVASAFTQPAYCAPAPAYAYPAPVSYSYYAAPAPVVYVQHRPVLVRPPVVIAPPVFVRPRVILPPPVVVAPPVFSLSFGFGGHGHHHHGGWR